VALGHSRGRRGFENGSPEKTEAQLKEFKMTKRTATSSNERPKKEQVEKFDMLQPMLESFLTEVRELSKKKPDGPLNGVKIKMINRILAQVKEALSTDASVEYLDLLDEEVLPQNSDAVLILGQYSAAMEQFKAKHYGYDTMSGRKQWFTQEG
jgi:hypothetical protein